MPQNPLTNGTYWGPVEPAEDILLEKLFLASGWLTGVFFGMQFVMSVSCIRVLWSERQRRYSNFLLIYTLILTSINFMYTITSYIGIQITFIDYRNFENGPLGVLGVEAPLPSNVISITCLVLGNVLADALLLWRCRIIWAASIGRKADWYMALPFVVLLASTAMGLLFDIEIANPTVGLFAKELFHVATAYFSLSLALTVTLTGMIAFRIRSYQRLITGSLGQAYAKQYTSITTMFVESSALYAFASLGLLITFARGSNIDQIFIGLSPGVQLIATYLIILRVADGRAWSADTMTRQHEISTLVFNTNRIQRSDPTRFTTSYPAQGSNVSYPLKDLKDTKSDSSGGNVNMV